MEGSGGVGEERLRGLSGLQPPAPGTTPPPLQTLRPGGAEGAGWGQETWEALLPTTPTVLESGEQMPPLAKQLLKQTARLRAAFFEADFVVGVGRCE